MIFRLSGGRGPWPYSRSASRWALPGGTLIGAYLAAWIDWRAAFLVMGIAGLVLAPIMLIFVRDLPRPSRPAAKQMPLARAFPIIARKPTFWLMAVAASCSSLAGYGLALWTPSMLERSFGFGLIERGQFLASIFLIGGTAGVFAGGWLADRLGQGDRRWYARLPAIAWLITAPTFAIGLLSPDPWLAWPLLLIPNALNILWLGPVDDGRAASGPAADALDRLGQLPADQQSDRPWRRPDR